MARLSFAAHLEPREASLRLNPAEHFLDALAASEAELIARMVRRALVDGRLPNLSGLGDGVALTAICGVTLRCLRSPTKAVTS